MKLPQTQLWDAFFFPGVLLASVPSRAAGQLARLGSLSLYCHISPARVSPAQDVQSPKAPDPIPAVSRKAPPPPLIFEKLSSRWTSTNHCPASSSFAYAHEFNKNTSPRTLSDRRDFRCKVFQTKNICRRHFVTFFFFRVIRRFRGLHTSCRPVMGRSLGPLYPALGQVSSSALVHARGLRKLKDPRHFGSPLYTQRPRWRCRCAGVIVSTCAKKRLLTVRRRQLLVIKY